MNGQAGFAHPSASYPYYRDHRAADGAAGYSDTLASAGPAKTLDSLYHSAAKHPEQVRIRPVPQRLLRLYGQFIYHESN